MTSGKLASIAVLASAVLSIFLSLLLPSFQRSNLNSGLLRSYERIRISGCGAAAGPESLAFDPNGEGPYTGVSDGRILKWQGKNDADDGVAAGGWAEFAFTSPHYLSRRNECEGKYDPKMERICGRPLGLRFDLRTGDLYIADAFYGLLRVGPAGGAAVPLVSKAHFANDLDIDLGEGVIYFTDSSTRFERRHFLSAIISGDRTGKLMQYKMETKQATLLVDGLSFPNGVALSEDGSFLLIVETAHSRILRHWLRTSKAGTTEVFAELLGFPDNIRRSEGRGDFWVALHSRRSKVLKLVMWVSPLVDSWLRLLLPWSWIDGLYPLLAGMRPSSAMAVRLSKEGQMLEVLEDRGGKVLKAISEVGERNGSLWIGSVLMPFVGLLKF